MEAAPGTSWGVQAARHAAPAREWEAAGASPPSREQPDSNRWGSDRRVDQGEPRESQMGKGMTQKRLQRASSKPWGRVQGIWPRSPAGLQNRRPAAESRPWLSLNKSRLQNVSFFLAERLLVCALSSAGRRVSVTVVELWGEPLGLTVVLRTRAKFLPN